MVSQNLFYGYIIYARGDKGEEGDGGRWFGVLKPKMEETPFTVPRTSVQF